MAGGADGREKDGEDQWRPERASAREGLQGSSAGLGRARSRRSQCIIVRSSAFRINCIMDYMREGGRMRGWVKRGRFRVACHGTCGCFCGNGQSPSVRDGGWHSKSNKLNHFEFDEYMLAMAQQNYATNTLRAYKYISIYYILYLYILYIYCIEFPNNVHI